MSIRTKTLRWKSKDHHQTVPALVAVLVVVACATTVWMLLHLGSAAVGSILGVWLTTAIAISLCVSTSRSAARQNLVLEQTNSELTSATIQGMLSVAEAKTARKAADEATKAKSQFLANMSHELRTPMNGVIGVLELLDHATLNSRDQEYLLTAQKSAERLLAVINNILDFSKIESGSLALESRLFSLRSVSSDLIRIFSNRKRASHVDLRIDIADGLPDQVIGDSHRVSQILINLVSNALKFTNEGHVELGISATRTGDETVRIHYRVEDTGEGIAESAMGRIMEAFQQADSSTTRTHGGTGLGLSISSCLVEMLGGSLMVESQVGSGSTFSFDLDHQIANQEAAIVPTVEIPVPSFDNRKVLVVDDNEVNRIVCCAMLETMGCSVVEAENGETAIQKWKSEEPDVVFMDWHMPVMDGLEATRNIRTLELRDTHTVIVALTASVLEDDVHACSNAGMDDFLAKPVRVEDLSLCLSRWLGAPV